MVPHVGMRMRTGVSMARTPRFRMPAFSPAILSIVEPSTFMWS